MWLGGQVRRAKATLGRERQERRIVVSICESCRSASLVSVLCIPLILSETAATQCDGGPMGHPKRLNPPLVTGISSGKEI